MRALAPARPIRSQAAAITAISAHTIARTPSVVLLKMRLESRVGFGLSDAAWHRSNSWSSEREKVAFIGADSRAEREDSLEGAVTQGLSVKIYILRLQFTFT